MSGCQRLVGGENKEWLLMNMGGSLWGDENVLELDTAERVYNLVNILNATEFYALKEARISGWVLLANGAHSRGQWNNEWNRMLSLESVINEGDCGVDYS